MDSAIEPAEMPQPLIAYPVDKKPCGLGSYVVYREREGARVEIAHSSALYALRREGAILLGVELSSQEARELQAVKEIEG